VDSAGATQTYSNYTSLGLGTCLGGTYTVTGGGARGTGCQYNLVDLYNQIAPKQERYSVNGRASFKFNDHVEGYLTGSFSHDFVSIKNQPRALRAPSRSADRRAWLRPIPASCCRSISAPRASTAPTGRCGRRLNPNNPYAAAFAGNPGERRGAHLLPVRRYPGRQRPHQRGVARFGGPEGRHRRRLELAHRSRRGSRTSWTSTSTAS
jgi:iron complex outermembrane receptor protein